MANNTIARLAAELFFKVDRTGLDRFKTELGGLRKEFESLPAASEGARKKGKKFFSDIQKQYSQLRPNLDEMQKHWFKVRQAMADGLDQTTMREAVDLEARILRDMDKERARIHKEQVRREKQEQAEKTKTRNEVIKTTRRYSSHQAKLMQIRDSVRAVNQARKEERISLEQAQRQVGELTREYRRLQAAQAGLSKTTVATGPFAGGQDPRQVGNHRLISALHSDVGLSAMVGGFAVAQSTRSYQDYLAMEQGIAAATGSKDQAKEEMKYLRDLSNEMGLFMGDLGSDYAKFAASARDTSLTIEQQRDVFKGVAAQVRILNLSAADSQRIFRALSQMMSSGQIMSQELKLQMGDQLPGAMRAMARAAHKLGITQDDSIASMNKAMEQGKLMSEEILPAFSEELWIAANQGGALREAMQNTGSAIGRFRTNFWYANRVFQESGMDRGIRRLINTLSDFILRSESLWRFTGQIGELFADALRGPAELMRSLGAAFDSVEGYAESLGLETRQLVQVFMLLHRWGRKILWWTWLLPGAMSGLAKIIDGEKLSWTQWGITIAGVAISLKKVYDLYKKMKGFGAVASVAAGAGAGSAAGSAAKGGLLGSLLSKGAIKVTLVGISLAGAAALISLIRDAFRDPSADTGLSFEQKYGELTGGKTFSEKVDRMLEDFKYIGDYFRRQDETGMDLLSGRYAASGNTLFPDPMVERYRQGMHMFDQFLYNTPPPISIAKMEINVDGSGDPSNVAERVYENFQQRIREASNQDPILER